MLRGGNGSRACIKIRTPEDPRNPSKIVFETINIRDEAALGEPFGLVAICR
jgi:hypothetical protein